MWSSWLNGSTLPALEQVTSFAQKRHLLLAGNIANLDTPDYQTRDISLTDFRTSLQEALDAGQPHSASQPDPMDKVRDISSPPGIANRVSAEFHFVSCPIVWVARLSSPETN